jgi:hypothetical protein
MTEDGMADTPNRSVDDVELAFVVCPQSSSAFVITSIFYVSLWLKLSVG